MTKHKTPDTTIPCAACNGSKVNPNAHPSHRAECGACFGSGLSTASYDQRRNATTITIRPGDPSPESRGLTVEHFTRNPKNGETICLVSWPNKNYRGG